MAGEYKWRKKEIKHESLPYFRDKEVSGPENIISKGIRMDFISYAKSLLPFSDRELEFCRVRLQSLNFKEGEYVHQPGEIHRKLYFISQGIARSYFLDYNGIDFTSSLHFNEPDSSVKNYFLVDYFSFLKQAPSLLAFEVIGEIQVEALTYQHVRELYEASQLWERFGRLMAEDVYYQMHSRIHSLQTESAKKRYQRLLEGSPNLIGKVPNYHLATYLGITAQSLSRIRKEIEQS